MAEKVEKLTIEVGGRNKSAGVFAEVERSIGKLKATAGEESVLGGLGKILRGGGAIAGITVTAGVLTNMLRTTNDLAKQLDAGAISIGQYRESLLQTVPVLGQIRQLGLQIREALNMDGAARELERWAKSMDQTSKVIAGILGGARGNSGASEGRIADARFADAAANPGTGVFGALRGLGIKQRGITAPIAGRYDKLKSDATTAAANERKRLLGELGSIDQRLEDYKSDANIFDFGADDIAIQLREERKNVEARLAAVNRALGQSLQQYESDMAAEMSGLLQGHIRDSFGTVGGSLADSLSKLGQGLRERLKSAGATGNPFGMLRRLFGGSNAAATPLIFETNPDRLDQAITAGQAGQRDRNRSVLEGAIGMAESELASLREGRSGVSQSLSGDTRRGITGVRSLGGSGNSGPSEREQQLEKTLQKLQEELKKLNGPDPIAEESLRVLKEMNGRLDPESQL